MLWFFRVTPRYSSKSKLLYLWNGARLHGPDDFRLSQPLLSITDWNVVSRGGWDRDDCLIVVIFQELFSLAHFCPGQNHSGASVHICTYSLSSEESSLYALNTTINSLWCYLFCVSITWCVCTAELVAVWSRTAVSRSVKASSWLARGESCWHGRRARRSPQSNHSTLCYTHTMLYSHRTNSIINY